MFEQPPLVLGDRNLEFARVEIEPSLGTIIGPIKESIIAKVQTTYLEKCTCMTLFQ